MDEFAALMEDDEGEGHDDVPPEDDDKPSPHEGLDEFALLLEQESIIDPAPPSYSRHSTTVQTKKKLSSSSTSISSSDRRSTISNQSSSTPAAVATVGVDERLGIRMINRHLSSLDLLDLITTTAPYLSPARMGAMSLQALCGILVDPPSIVDRATVQGRTHLVTVGIVFENSGTKTSSKGGAFVILTIGSNLESGPCLSIFLFGSAYTKYGKIGAGQVVAISNPKLLPARDDNGGRSDTSLSLSIYDVAQLVHVAKARDYGVCKAIVSGKQPDGKWKKNASNCKTFVDTRRGDYCPFHAKKQKQQKGHIANCSPMRGMGGMSNVVGKRGNNMVQDYKASRATPMDASSRHTTTAAAGNRFLGNKSSTGAMGNNVARLANAARNTVSSGVASANKYLAGQPSRPTPNAAAAAAIRENRVSSNIPMHMKKEDPRRTMQQVQSNCDRSGNGNRFTANSTKRKVPASGQPSRGLNGSNKKEKTTTSGDWMQEAASRRKPAAKSLSSFMPTSSGRKQVRKVNTAGCGLDGSVVVPKPNKLFMIQAPTISRAATSSMKSDEMRQIEADKIKEQQSLLAEKLRERRTGLSVDNRKTSGGLANNAKGKTTPSSSSGNSFLDSIHVDDVAAVLNAKSKFASEAEAEDYAKNRRRVVELERLETKDSKRQSATKEKENQKIQVTWICYTCPNRPRFAKSPKPCFNACHDVKRERHVKEAASKLDERTKLHEKGGLTLGSGLEWSKDYFNQVN